MKRYTAKGPHKRPCDLCGTTVIPGDKMVTWCYVGEDGPSSSNIIRVHETCHAIYEREGIEEFRFGRAFHEDRGYGLGGVPINPIKTALYDEAMERLRDLRESIDDPQARRIAELEQENARLEAELVAAGTDVYLGILHSDDYSQAEILVVDQHGDGTDQVVHDAAVQKVFTHLRELVKCKEHAWRAAHDALQAQKAAFREMFDKMKVVVAALHGVVGVDTPSDLPRLRESVLSTPAPADDKTIVLKAIDALMAFHGMKQS